jgi:hypothetical protein
MMKYLLQIKSYANEVIKQAADRFVQVIDVEQNKTLLLHAKVGLMYTHTIRYRNYNSYFRSRCCNTIFIYQ